MQPSCVTWHDHLPTRSNEGFALAIDEAQVTQSADMLTVTTINHFLNAERFLGSSSGDRATRYGEGSSDGWFT